MGMSVLMRTNSRFSDSYSKLIGLVPVQPGHRPECGPLLSSVGSPLSLRRRGSGSSRALHDPVIRSHPARAAGLPDRLDDLRHTAILSSPDERRIVDRQALPGDVDVDEEPPGIDVVSGRGAEARHVLRPEAVEDGHVELADVLAEHG